MAECRPSGPESLKYLPSGFYRGSLLITLIVKDQARDTKCSLKQIHTCCVSDGTLMVENSAMRVHYSLRSTALPGAVLYQALTILNAQRKEERAGRMDRPREVE